MSTFAFCYTNFFIDFNGHSLKHDLELFSNSYRLLHLTEKAINNILTLQTMNIGILSKDTSLENNLRSELESISMSIKKILVNLKLIRLLKK